MRWLRHSGFPPSQLSKAIIDQQIANDIRGLIADRSSGGAAIVGTAAFCGEVDTHAGICRDRDPTQHAPLIIEVRTSITRVSSCPVSSCPVSSCPASTLLFWRHVDHPGSKVVNCFNCTPACAIKSEVRAPLSAVNSKCNWPNDAARNITTACSVFTQQTLANQFTLK